MTKLQQASFQGTTNLQIRHLIFHRYRWGRARFVHHGLCHNVVCRNYTLKQGLRSGEQSNLSTQEIVIWKGSKAKAKERTDAHLLRRSWFWWSFSCSDYKQLWSSGEAHCVAASRSCVARYRALKYFQRDRNSYSQAANRAADSWIQEIGLVSSLMWRFDIGVGSLDFFSLRKLGCRSSLKARWPDQKDNAARSISPNAVRNHRA